MIYVSTFPIILYVVLCHSQISAAEIYQETIDQTPIASTCSPETVAQVFTAVLYIDLISAHNPEIVFGLILPSDIAAELYYKVKLGILKEEGLFNAEELASISHSATLLADEFKISLYYFFTANTIGEYLVEKGFLNCGNVIQKATTFFYYEESEFRSLDSDAFESYLGAIIAGTTDFLESLGFTGEDIAVNWKILTEKFYKKYSNYASTLV